MAVKKGGLGRGLDALFADAVPLENGEEPVKDNQTEKHERTEKPKEGAVVYLSVHDIAPNKEQPRKFFDEEKLTDLANSIKEHGVIQPVVVREKGKGYEIVAGERRWRASIKAGLKEIPCIIKTLSDEDNMLFAIIENMQREDLNPIEEAEGLSTMIDTFLLTQEEVAKSVGKSRPYITNALRLLKLPKEVREMVSTGKLSAAHARTIAGASGEELQKEIANFVALNGLSVRDTEKLVSEGPKKKKKQLPKEKDADVERVEAELKASLGTKVTINGNSKKGKIEIEYFSRDELERLIDILRDVN